VKKSVIDKVMQVRYSYVLFSFLISASIRLARSPLLC